MVIGVCLSMAILAVVRLPWTGRFAQSSPGISHAAYLLFYFAAMACYPAWVIRRRTAGPILRWPGIGRLAKEAGLAVPVTLCLSLLMGAIVYAWKHFSSNPVAPMGEWDCALQHE